MDAFLGTWKFESSEGFGAILQRLGVSQDLVKIADATDNTLEITSVGDDEYKFVFMSAVKSSEDTVILGREFEEITPDGRIVKSTITIEGGIMKHVQVSDGKTITISRAIEGGKMKTTVEFEDLRCIRWYKKQ